MTETPPALDEVELGYSGTPQQAGDSSMERMATLSPGSMDHNVRELIS
jgi:hypothetical protein